MKKVVIVGASRTPMGGFHGEMSQATAPELGGAAIKGAIENAGVKNESIDEVIMGNVLSAGQGQAQTKQQRVERSRFCSDQISGDGHT